MFKERGFSPEAPKRRGVCFGELPLDESNEFQIELAVEEFDRFHEGEEVASVPSGKKVLWWIQNGFAKAYGDYSVAHADDRFDMQDESARAELLEALERAAGKARKETVH